MCGRSSVKAAEAANHVLGNREGIAEAGMNIKAVCMELHLLTFLFLF